MIYFDFRGNESLNFYETERITDLRLFDNKTLVMDTMYTTDKRKFFSRSALVDIKPHNIHHIKRNLSKNQISIYEVKRLSDELYEIVKGAYKK